MRIIGYIRRVHGGSITASESIQLAKVFKPFLATDMHHVRMASLMTMLASILLFCTRPGPSNPYFGHAMERAWPTIFGCTDPSISDTCGGENYNITGCQCCEWFFLIPIDRPTRAEFCCQFVLQSIKRESVHMHGYTLKRNTLKPWVRALLTYRYLRIAIATNTVSSRSQEKSRQNVRTHKRSFHIKGGRSVYSKTRQSNHFEEAVVIILSFIYPEVIT